MKKINFINLCLILLLLVGNAFLILTDLVWIKVGLSLGFVLIGAINLIYAFKSNFANKKFTIFMFTGLVFAMLGDIVIEFNFIGGAILFAIAHVMFFVSYCFNVPFNWKNLLFAMITFVPVTLFMIFAPIFNFGGVFMECVCIIYALIISCMFGKSISNFVSNKNALNLILLIGSALFVISDFILLLNVFSAVSKHFSFLCIATYYPAECLLAYSILKSKKKVENHD